MKTRKVNYFTTLINNFSQAGQAANLEIAGIKADNLKAKIYQKRLANGNIGLLYRETPSAGVVEDTFELISSRGVEAIKTTTVTKLTKGEPAEYLHVVVKKFIDGCGNVGKTLTKQRFIK